MVRPGFILMIDDVLYISLSFFDLVGLFVLSSYYLPYVLIDKKVSTRA